MTDQQLKKFKVEATYKRTGRKELRCWILVQDQNSEGFKKLKFALEYNSGPDVRFELVEVIEEEKEAIREVRGYAEAEEL